MMEEKINILLIEDNKSDARFIDIYLKEAFGPGFELHCAELLQEGLELINERQFNIILVDLSLPDSSGLETFQAVHLKTPETPVIVLTGNLDESVGMNAVKLGAQDFLIKGKIRSRSLRRSINYSIERYKLLKQLGENTKQLQEQASALRAEKQKLASALKLAHVGSWVWDIDKNEITWSEELQRIFSFNPRATKATYEKFLKYVHPEDRIAIRDSVEEALKGGQVLNLFHRIVRNDHTVRLLHTRGEVLISNEGRAFCMVGTCQDVTERQHEEDLEKLVMAATKSYNSVVIRNREGQIEWVNEGFTKLSGYTLNHVKNTYGEALKNGNEKDVIEQKNYYERVLRHKAPVSYENKNYTRKGIGYWTITTLTPVLDQEGDVERIIAIDSDITLRKQMEEELLTANKIAEHSLMKGNKALTELMVAKKQLELSMKVKEEFLANMSHEIRTPMNAIVGFTDLLMKARLPDELQQYIKAIKTSGENLLVIINDILDFSKIEKGKIVFEQISLHISQIVSTVVELLLPKSMEKEVNLSTRIDKRIPENLIGDPTRLSQILLNLVGNAIKFTEKGEVLVNVELISKEKDKVKVLFLITDTGIGIPKEKLATIFEGFTQASNTTTRKYGGTGLGLTIVKQLVELQGGKVSVESEESRGSTFSFELELKVDTDEQPFSKPDESPEEIPGIEGIKVLLVEDNYLNQLLAKKVLGDWKWSVDVADNGLMAVEKLEQGDYDVILMDIQLPEMDGYEATRFIRKNFNGAKGSLPIIAMTAHAISGEAEKCRAAGMDEYISKPFDPKVLYSKIIRAMHTSKQGHEQEENGEPLNEKNKEEKFTNLDYLHSLAKGNEGFVKEMIRIFSQQTPEAIRTLKKALDSSDWDTVGAIAHKMKPSFSFMGIHSMKEVIEALERNAKKQVGGNETAVLIKRLESVCNKAILELNIPTGVA
ncbi:MAG: response regulator [Bacteroidia bacterium]